MIDFIVSDYEVFRHNWFKIKNNFLSENRTNNPTFSVIIIRRCVNATQVTFRKLLNIFIFH